jgi:hypothetical protein
MENEEGSDKCEENFAVLSHHSPVSVVNDSD